MSARVRSLIKKLLGKTDSYRLLIIGLDASGKTTILYKLKLGEIVTTIPTIGFNVETIVYQNTSLTMWDVGGCDKIRPLIRHYLPGTNALICVVDANDRERLSEMCDALWYLISQEEASNIPILVYLNKMDLVNPMNSMHVTEKLQLTRLRVPWFLQKCVAKTGDGLYEGLAWLIQILKSDTQPTPMKKVEQPSDVRSTTTTSHDNEEKFLQWLAVEDEDTAEEFVAKFCSQQSLGNHFDHRTLLRIIWSCLELCGRKDTVKKIFDHIRHYLTNTNESLVYFWIQIVHYARESSKNPPNIFSDFLVLNPQLLNEKDLPLTYYKQQTLLSDQAKSSIVLPDLKPLPSIIPKDTTSTASAVPIKNLDDQDEIIKNLSDDEFLHQFETYTLTSWSHKTHLRMAWLYLTRHGRREGMKKIFDGIKNFIDHSPVSRKTTFHLTMTYFWIQMIDLAIATHRKDLTFEEFIQLNPHLMNGGLFLEYYKKETMLNNPTARAEFVPPDIKPLPTLVITSKTS